MDLSREYNPVPKTVTKKPNRNRKKRKQKGVEVFKGVKVPHRKQRAKIKRQAYNKALTEWGEQCFCGNPFIEMHHVVFRSQQGRGGFRNLHPLCKKHHDLAHKDRVFADWLRSQHENRYGPHYFKDCFDLWKEGHIENPTPELFEKFMRGEKDEKAKRI